MLVVLRNRLEEVKEEILKAPIEHVGRLQGEGRAYTALINVIINTPPSLTGSKE